MRCERRVAPTHVRATGRVHRGTCAAGDASLSRLECVPSVTRQFPYSYGKRRASWFFERLSLFLSHSISLRFASLACSFDSLSLSQTKVIHARVYQDCSLFRGSGRSLYVTETGRRQHRRCVLIPRTGRADSA